MENYLAHLGVSQNLLSVEEILFLEQKGYLVLGKLLSDQDLDLIRSRIEGLIEEEGPRAGAELAESKHIRHPKEPGAVRLADLVNKGSVFDRFYTQPKVLAAIVHVLGSEFKLSSLNYRAALPGHGLQKLHVDWHESVQTGDYKVCNSIWLLDDFTSENGATRLVPGTHKRQVLPQEALPDPNAPHPEQILLEASAGTVVIFNSHVWHGGTQNNSPLPRRAIHSYFCRRDQAQQINQKKYIRSGTRKRLSEAALTILDV